jgi:hypothetical protein
MNTQLTHKATDDFDLIGGGTQRSSMGPIGETINGQDYPA